MKKISVIFCVHLWTIFLFVSVSAQDFKTIQDGIEYAEVIRGTKDAPIRVNLLKLDLTKMRLDVVHAMDSAIGVEKTSSIATRHGAIAAINAGFFRLDTSIFAGDSAGVLQIDGKLLSESHNNRIAIGIINRKDKTEVNFGHFKLNYLGLIGKFALDFDGINRERKNDELIIYTPEFGRTTLTNPNGTEVIVKNGKITAIVKSGSNFIPADGFVISASGKTENELVKSSKIGAKFSLSVIQPISMLDDEKEQKEEEKRNPTTIIDTATFKKTEDITNGVPQLIKNGKIEITWEQEKAAKAFVENKHPRTAVAKLNDGKFLMVTVDGRQPETSVGMDLQELAEFLLELGAVDAMNLDGGGSTTMFLDGKVVNKPSDKEGERKVSDAILVTPRK